MSNYIYPHVRTFDFRIRIETGVIVEVIKLDLGLGKGLGDRLN